MRNLNQFARLRRRALGAAIGATTLGLALPILSPAHAQTESYPSRTITIVVPYGAGSATDLLARLIAPGLSAQLGQSVIVDNKPGAGGSIGTTLIARARPDGYTLGMAASATFGVNPHLYKNLAFDPRKDFTPLIKLATTPNALVVPAQSEIRSVSDLLAQMKKRQLRYNSFGNGTTQHLAGALLAHQAGVKADHIPYRSAGDALTALLSGQEIDFAFQALPAVISYVKSGRLRAIGVTTVSPSPALPDVPPIGTQGGLKDFDKTSVWWGLVGPAGIDGKITRTLHEALTKALADPAMQARLQEAGYVPAAPNTPAEFGSFIVDQLQFWGELVKVSGAKVD